MSKELNTSSSNQSIEPGVPPDVSVQAESDLLQELTWPEIEELALCLKNETLPITTDLLPKKIYATFPWQTLLPTEAVGYFFHKYNRHRLHENVERAESVKAQEMQKERLAKQTPETTSADESEYYRSFPDYAVPSYDDTMKKLDEARKYLSYDEASGSNLTALGEAAGAISTHILEALQQSGYADQNGWSSQVLSLPNTVASGETPFIDALQIIEEIAHIIEQNGAEVLQQVSVNYSIKHTERRRIVGVIQHFERFKKQYEDNPYKRANYLYTRLGAKVEGTDVINMMSSDLQALLHTFEWVKSRVLLGLLSLKLANISNRSTGYLEPEEFVTSLPTGEDMIFLESLPENVRTIPAFARANWRSADARFREIMPLALQKIVLEENKKEGVYSDIAAELIQSLAKILQEGDPTLLYAYIDQLRDLLEPYTEKKSNLVSAVKRYVEENLVKNFSYSNKKADAHALIPAYIFSSLIGSEPELYTLLNEQQVALECGNFYVSHEILPHLLSIIIDSDESQRLTADGDMQNALVMVLSWLRQARRSDEESTTSDYGKKYIAESIEARFPVMDKQLQLLQFLRSYLPEVMSNADMKKVIPFLGEYSQEYFTLLTTAPADVLRIVCQSIRQGIVIEDETAKVIQLFIEDLIATETDEKRFEVFLELLVSTLDEQNPMRTSLQNMKDAEVFGQSRVDVFRVSRMLRRLNIPLSKEMVDVSSTIDLHLVDLLVSQGITQRTAVDCACDLAFYTRYHEDQKRDFLTRFLEATASSSEKIVSILVALRRVHTTQVTEKTLPEDIERIAHENMEAIETRWQEFNATMNPSYDDTYSSRHIHNIELILTSLGIPFRMHWLENQHVPVPQGLHLYKENEARENVSYPARLLRFLVERITMRNALGMHSTYVDAFDSEFQSLWTDTKRNVDITESLWKYVLKRRAEEKPTILILNESTCPRYFGRDVVDPTLMDALGIATRIDDLGVLRFCIEKRPTLRFLSKKVRTGKPFTSDDQVFIQLLREKLNMRPDTKILPLQEFKIKSGSNDHDMRKTQPLLQDIACIAEILGADIVFADISSNAVGRSQQNARKLMSGITRKMESHGHLKDTFPVNPALWKKHESMRFSTFVIPALRDLFFPRKQSQVTFINFDPNSQRTSAHADDRNGFTVRDRLRDNGIYDHTQESMRIISPSGEFVSLETYWQYLITRHIYDDLQAEATQSPDGDSGETAVNE